jgi:hypothetical protein
MVQHTLAKKLLIVSGLLFLAAGFMFMRARSLRREGVVRAERSAQAARAFSDTFSERAQAIEMQLLDERRALLMRASAWSRFGAVALMLMVLSLLGAWLARELYSFHDLLAGSNDLPRDKPPQSRTDPPNRGKT